MKLKWIAVLLACVLLLCGCASTIKPADEGTQTTTTEEKNSTPTRVSKKWVLSDAAVYRETMGNVHSIENIRSLLSNFGWPDVVPPENFEMVLEDKFFLIPSLKNSTITAITLDGSGYTEFDVQLSDDCTLYILVHHSKRLDFSDKAGKMEFETVDGNLFVHEHNTNKADVFYMRAGNYWVVIGGFDVCECKQSYVENLTFEKVEIK